MRIFLPVVRQKKGEACQYSFQGKIKDYFDPGADDDSSFAVTVNVRSVGDKIIIEGNFQAEIEATCCRCLCSFRQQLNSDFNEVFTLTPLLDKASTPEDLALETANQLTVSGDYLYLNEYLRQLFYLSQVYNPLCKPDCRGLCAGCGADLNRNACSCEDEAQIDLRLLKLKEFQSRNQA
ncbi:MAG: DUF177 domain-containing protein [Firmicutes bacterium]|jgi:uncharacterized protein|nr:DUF177 domain-containing protein [Bacillota bacterium]HPU01559.1 DUF177 domain-containing protein [Bacillota bacterium]